MVFPVHVFLPRLWNRGGLGWCSYVSIYPTFNQGSRSGHRSVDGHTSSCFLKGKWSTSAPPLEAACQVGSHMRRGRALFCCTTGLWASKGRCGEQAASRKPARRRPSLFGVWLPERAADTVGIRASPWHRPVSAKWTTCRLTTFDAAKPEWWNLKFYMKVARERK